MLIVFFFNDTATTEIYTLSLHDALPTAFALYNWAAQWATYHLVLRATHVPVSLAASFTALIVVNLSGLLRPTPANVGVTQAALVVGLLPFGVAPEQAVPGRFAL